MLLSEKVAIIAGASRGMGREVAIAFAQAGARGIIVTAAPAVDETLAEIEAELQEVTGKVSDAGAQAIGVVADVTNWSDCQNVVDKALEAFGTLDILLHNAGKSQRYHGARDIPFWETDHDGWQEVIVTNVVGPYFMAKAAIPHMLKQGRGRIIITSKSADSQHEAFAGAYGPSKAAVEAHVLSWAEETSGTGVNCNCINPGGAVNTRFGRGAALQRGLNPAVMNNLAVWLASDLSADYNGCRFSAKYWDETLPVAQAADLCREAPLFPVPMKPSKLTRAWKETTRGSVSRQFAD